MTGSALHLKATENLVLGTILNYHLKREILCRNCLKRYFYNLMRVFPKDDFFLCSFTTNARKSLGEPLYWQLGSFIPDNLWI